MEPYFNRDVQLENGVLAPKQLKYKGIIKIAIALFLLCVFFVMWFMYTELYVNESQNVEQLSFVVKQGESVDMLSRRLKSENVIRNAWLFKKYLVYKGIDRQIQAGDYEVVFPVTLSRVAFVLKNTLQVKEKKITIIPGWDLREIADYFVENKIIKEPKELFELVGESAVMYTSKKSPQLTYSLELLKFKPDNVSYEGYLAPDTYRIFDDATLDDVVRKIATQQNKLFTRQMYLDIENAGRTVHQVLTMASLLEREVRTPDEKAKVADIFWRRLDNKWALQADSTVHYAVNKKGNVFTTKTDRDTDSLWNTYKLGGLPPSPICAPSLESIKAAIYPKKNNYWFFLTTFEGEVKYATDLDGHNANVQKYLR